MPFDAPLRRFARPADTAAALLLTAAAGLAAQTASGPATDPLTDQETAPPTPRVDLSEADLVEPMAPSDYVPPIEFEPLPAGPAEPGVERRERTGAPAPPTAVDLDTDLTAPLHAPDGEGGHWVRIRNLRAHFEADAVTAFPVFGEASPREWPVRFSLASATVGGEPLALGRGGAPAMGADGARVEVGRGALTEAWNLDAEALEQTFVFDELPGSGDVVVHVDVETDLAATEEGQDLVFRHGEFGFLRYGAAFAVDAAGRTLAIERAFDGERITLTVPAHFAAEATLPLTIDPQIDSFTNGTGVNPSEVHVDICYAGATNRYYFAWEDRTSSVNSDIYVSSFTASGTQGPIVLLDASSEWWGTPSIGFVAGHDRILVASSVSINGPGTWPSQIRGHLFDPVAGTVVGSDFGVSTSGTEKREPVVGGTNAELTSNNHFLVAWSRILGSDRWSIEYRVVDFDGSGVTGVRVVDDTPNARNRQPEVSASHGDARLSGDYWTLAWTASPSGTFFGLGRIKARRIVFSGDPQFGGGNFTVNNNLNCSSPSVSSRLDRGYANSFDRPSLVAYVVHDTSTLYGDIFVSVVNAGVTNPPNPITLMEDSYPEWNQFEPAIASDGRAFILAYTQRFPTSTPTNIDLDICMCSGNIAEDGSVARVGLAERTQLIELYFSAEQNPQIAMVQDGDNTTNSDDGMIAYRVSSTNGTTTSGHTVVATVEANTLQFAPDRTAVGRQYCDANVNVGGPPVFGADASWIWVEGDQVAGSLHRVHCNAMPFDVSAILLCSRQTGNVNLAGGQGRLCLGGSIGRFTSLLANSGSDGAVTFPVDTSALPEGSSLVAAQPGETWHFQTWHREFGAFFATSNYSNAASVTFTP